MEITALSGHSEPLNPEPGTSKPPIINPLPDALFLVFSPLVQNSGPYS